MWRGATDLHTREVTHNTHTPLGFPHSSCAAALPSWLATPALCAGLAWAARVGSAIPASQEVEPLTHSHTHTPTHPLPPHSTHPTKHAGTSLSNGPRPRSPPRHRPPTHPCRCAVCVCVCVCVCVIWAGRGRGAARRTRGWMDGVWAASRATRRRARRAAMRDRLDATPLPTPYLGSTQGTCVEARSTNVLDVCPFPEPHTYTSHHPPFLVDTPAVAVASRVGAC